MKISQPSGQMDKGYKDIETARRCECLRAVLLWRGSRDPGAAGMAMRAPHSLFYD